MDVTRPTPDVYARYFSYYLKAKYLVIISLPTINIVLFVYMGRFFFLFLLLLFLLPGFTINWTKRSQQYPCYNVNIFFLRMFSSKLVCLSI